VQFTNSRRMMIKKRWLRNWFWIFSSRICQSLYDVKPKAQSERCPLTVQLANTCAVRDGAVTLKGSHAMGDGLIFPKTSVPLFLMTTYQMSLIWARSTLLDSTFKAILCRGFQEM
jgi:hypothetical protein